MARFFIFVLVAAFGLQSCNSPTEGDDLVVNSEDTLPNVLIKMRAAHGELGNYQFDFRAHRYTFRFNEDGYEYTRLALTDSVKQLDVLTNNGLRRYVNDQEIALSSDDQNKYAESINSVIYFVCLPLKVFDPAVVVEMKNPTKIKGAGYDVVRVSFKQEGGGTDFQDVFYYWINQSTHQMDYLAYQYAVNGGGVRFRSAFNSRMVGNMRFQDYVNYAAPVGTPLDSLPILFESNQLTELSLIETTHVHELP